MPKSAKDRMAAKAHPKRVVLEKDFAGVRAGQVLFVGTPQIIAEYIAKIPYGQTRTIPQMRGELARRRKCDATCPVSTSIFIRTAAQAAIEDLEAGVPTSDVLPFWRLLTANDKIAKRLSIDPEWIDLQRALEVENA